MRNKKIAALLLSVTMMASVAACGGTGTTPNVEKSGKSASTTTAAQAQRTDSGASATAAQAIDGGWEINRGALSLDQNAEAKKAFERAMEKLVGADYEPIAVLASQVVAGTNYCILCRVTPTVPDAEPSYSLVYVYEEPGGKAKVTNVSDLIAPAEEGQTGAWEVNTGKVPLDNNADAQKAFEKALDGMTGADYEAIALLGTQVVSGTNYLLLCRVTPVIPDAEPSFCLVTVYEDLEGKAEISEIQDLDIAAQSESSDADATQAAAAN